MSWLNSVVEGVGGLLGGGISSAFGQHSADEQRRWQRQVLLNQHQWEVEDLKKAGLNPILSASHGPIGAPSISPLPAGEVGRNVSDSMMKAVQLYLDSQRLQNETSATNSAVMVNNAKVDTERAQAELFRSNSAVAAQQAQNLSFERQEFSPQKIRESKALEKYHGSASQLSETRSKLDKITYQLEALKLPLAKMEARHPSIPYMTKHTPVGLLGALGYLFGKTVGFLGKGVSANPGGLVDKHVPPIPGKTGGK